MKYIRVEDTDGVNDRFERLLERLPREIWFEVDSAAGAVGALQEYQGYVNGVVMGLKLQKLREFPYNLGKAQGEREVAARERKRGRSTAEN